ncbi:hypothetical protein HPB48_026195 [Haemaphysalis longicornis]|uniref:Nuclease HARBI1 n=1 Tax=Haemaphysalis longicornis TaxID=44386 RepID=A0A9J6HAU3_HAELO|nr:hypothetical protein HPB48_026195 [Haemaphysalis longicornis]
MCRDHASGIGKTPWSITATASFSIDIDSPEETIVDLLARLPTNRGSPIPPMLQLLIALRFYGVGTFQVVTGDLVNVSQPTVCRAVKRMSELIWGAFSVLKLRSPTTRKFHDIACDFYKITKFPGNFYCPHYYLHNN